MRAAVFEGVAPGLRVQDVPRPVPGPGEVLVQVAACGLCGTDLHYLLGEAETAKPPPIILGHEISGIVRELGVGATGPTVGTRVLIPPVLPCGNCRLCRTGRENVCANLRMVGNHLNGGFAEFVAVPSRDLVILPEDLPLAESAVIADALSTPYHAVVNRARVQPGEWVVLVGCGGLGTSALQFARLAGAHVIAVDVQPERLERARALGAAETLNARESDVPKAVRKLTHGGADVALELVGSPETFTTTVSSLRRGGRACVVGYSHHSAPLPLGRLMFFEQEILGSLGCRPADYPVIVELVRRGRVRLEPIVTGRVGLEGIPEALNDLRQGRGLRTLVVPTDGAVPLEG
jgi:6-hydroxycyclohex-1-ene-1-carbonyl-CoA dehydrogenase